MRDSPVALPVGGLESVMRLRAFDAFAALTPARIAALAELTEERFFPAGAVVERGGAPVREVHYVIEGEVEVRPPAGAPVRLGALGVINGLASFAGHTRADEVVAVVDTTTLSVSYQDLEDVLEEHFEIFAGVLRAVAGTYLDARHEHGTTAGAVAPGPATAPAPRLGVVAKMAALRSATPFDQAPLEALAELAR